MSSEGRNGRVEVSRVRVPTQPRAAKGPRSYVAPSAIVLCVTSLFFDACTEPSYGGGGADEAEEAGCTTARCTADQRSDDASVTKPSGGGQDGGGSDGPRGDSGAGNDGIRNDAGGALPDAGAADAGNPPTTPSDSGIKPLPPNPPGESPIKLGNYVVQARNYGIESSSSAGYAEESTMLGRVTRNPETNVITMHLELCANYGNTELAGFTTTARITKLADYPQRDLTVQVTGDVFQTTGGATYAGYVPGNAATCPAGTLVKAPVGQTWHPNGQCKCVAGDAPPANIDDCRVIDSDADGHPGFTVGWTGGVDRDVYAVRRDSNLLVDGKVDPAGRHTASYVWKQDHVLVQCATGSCPNSTSVAFRPCVLGVVNPVRFAPLADLAPSGAAWTCAEMLQSTGALFTEPLAVPRGC